MPRIIGAEQITDWDEEEMDSDRILDLIFDKYDGYSDFLNFAEVILDATIVFDEESSTYKMKYHPK